MKFRPRLIIAALAAGAALAACAAQQKAPATSPAPSSAAPAPSKAADIPAAGLSSATKQEAAARLAAAERQLDQLFPAGAAVSGQSAQPMPAAPPMPAEHAPAQSAEQEKDRAKKSAQLGEEGAGQVALADRCAIACEALGSMRRAADDLCGMTGESDDDCVDARARVDRSAARVRAECPACAQ